MTTEHHSLIEAFRAAGQEQVFAFFDQLDAPAQAHLLLQAAEIDLDEVRSLVAEHVVTQASPAQDLVGLEPASYIAHPAKGGDDAEWLAARSAGEAALRCPH